jgi:citrate lyase subunit alpha / citrate CoA-transferase
VVTDQGIAVNPLRQELFYNLKNAKLPVLSIDELKAKTDKIVGKPEPIRWSDKIIGLVKYRDGSIIDVIRKVKKEL